MVRSYLYIWELTGLDHIHICTYGKAFVPDSLQLENNNFRAIYRYDTTLVVTPATMWRRIAFNWRVAEPHVKLFGGAWFRD